MYMCRAGAGLLNEQSQLDVVLQVGHEDFIIPRGWQIGQIRQA